MFKLNISKQEEAQAVARVWNMGVSSLSPDSYGDLEEALKQMCRNRNIDNEVVARYQIEISGKRIHYFDCETSNSPACLPGPCNCDA